MQAEHKNAFCGLATWRKHNERFPTQKDISWCFSHIHTTHVHHSYKHATRRILAELRSHYSVFSFDARVLGAWICSCIMFGWFSTSLYRCWNSVEPNCFYIPINVQSNLWWALETKTDAHAWDNHEPDVYFWVMYDNLYVYLPIVLIRNTKWRRYRNHQWNNICFTRRIMNSFFKSIFFCKSFRMPWMHRWRSLMWTWGSPKVVLDGRSTYGQQNWNKNKNTFELNYLMPKESGMNDAIFQYSESGRFYDIMLLFVEI